MDTQYTRAQLNKLVASGVSIKDKMALTTENATYSVVIQKDEKKLWKILLLGRERR